MKTFRSLYLITLMIPAALVWSGCSKNDNASTAVDKAAADVKGVAVSVKASVSDSWDGIKDYTLEKRAEFSASMDRMAGTMDDKTNELKAKFAGATDSASKDRESAVTEYDQARADLKSRLSDLGNATADTWADAKEKVAQAWKRVQAAYNKLTSSTPS
jgi:hypothetical protein